jgi:hypothetical protein
VPAKGEDVGKVEDHGGDNTSFFEALTEMALQAGAVVLEAHRCEKCNEVFVNGHVWQEVITCTHCKHQQASKVPRRPQPGEVTIDHLVNALQTLMTCYQNTPGAKFTDGAEWEALPDQTKLLITQNISAAIVAALKQVDSLAVGFATAPRK